MFMDRPEGGWARAVGRRSLQRFPSGRYRADWRRGSLVRGTGVLVASAALAAGLLTAVGAAPTFDQQCSRTGVDD